MLANQPPIITSQQCCPNCENNMTAIAELTKTFPPLEAKVVHDDLTPSYRELLDKVKAIEEERDSHLTGLRLLEADR